ncbi:MAG: TetR/AcrR family transcriptional regulator [Anaerolineae bacterium]|nr:TetR/AcrR family transcriptional regulator [Anaerolineae bacterium]
MPIQQRAEETRARILNAAADCFAQHGYEAASVAEICERAGVSKGAFYHHFPSKQDLFMALLNDWLEGLDAGLRAVQVQAANVPQALRDMAGMVGFVLSSAGERLPMFLEFWTQAARDPDVWAATIAPYRRYREFFVQLVRAGVAEGSLRPVDAEVAAQVIVSLAVGTILQGLLDSSGADWDRSLRQGIDMILESMEAP